jgi:hypothetical protein
MSMQESATIEKVPAFFKPLLWSYQFDEIDAARDMDTIIVQTINYGTLKHLRWIWRVYGVERIRALLAHVPATSIRPGARALAALLFDISEWNYASRGTH